MNSESNGSSDRIPRPERPEERLRGEGPRSAEGFLRIAATLTGASILGIRRLNVARSELIQRAPIAGSLVDDAIVIALSGVGPSAKLTAEACNAVASLSPEPIADGWRLVGDAATTVGRVVRLTGLDQPAPTTRRSPR